MTHRIIKTEQDRDEWFPAPGMGGIYEITCDGRVRSLDRYVNSPITGGKRLVRGRIVKLQSIKGYPAFQVSRTGGKKSTVYVHRLVALAFVPNPKGRPHVNHINGNKSNNTPSNLEWVSHAENMRHAYDTGLTPRQKLKSGEDSIAAKLTGADVRKIRAMLANKTTQQAIADQFGVSKGTIGAIARGETWRTLDA